MTRPETGHAQPAQGPAFLRPRARGGGGPARPPCSARGTAPLPAGADTLAPHATAAAPRLPAGPAIRSHQPPRPRLASASRPAAGLALALLAAPALAQDTTAPSLSTVTHRQGIILLTYNEALDTSSTPAASQFTVSYGDVSVSVNSVNISTVTPTLLSLSLELGPIPGETVKVSYSVPTSNPIQDTSGNDAPAFSDQGLTTAVSWSSISLESATATHNTGVALVFSAGQLGSTGPHASRFSVTAGGTARTIGSRNYHTGLGSPLKGRVWLTGISPPIAKGDTVTVSYATTLSATQKGVRLFDASDNPLQAFSGTTVTNNAPELIQSAVVVGDQLTLTFSGNLTTSPLPAPGQFSAQSGVDFGTNNIVTGISASGSALTLTLTRKFVYGDVVRVTYDKPTTNPLKDADGREIDDLTISPYPVTNNTPADVLRAEASGTSLVLTYRGPLCATTVAEVCTANVPGTGDFAVKVAGTARSVSAVAVAGSTVELTLSSAIGATDAVTVKYTRPTANRLQDDNGNEPVTTPEIKADNTSRLLVRNSLQGDTTFNNLGGDYAQAFTTGSSAFKLTRADLWMSNALTSTPAAAWTLSVHEVDSSGLPGTSLGSLATSDTVPVGAPFGRIEHAHSGTGIDLAADTTYFLVLDASTGTNLNLVQGEESDSEDAGAAPGWSLADRFRRRTNTVTTWTGSLFSDDALRIALHGRSTDTTAPALQSLAVSGATLTLTYDETLDPGSVPAASAFAVTVAGAARAVSAVAVAGSKVTLTLASAVTAGQAVTLAYTAPSASPLRDVAAPHYNNAATFAARNVANSSGVTLVGNTGQTAASRLLHRRHVRGGQLVPRANLHDRQQHGRLHALLGRPQAGLRNALRQHPGEHLHHLVRQP